MRKKLVILAFALAATAAAALSPASAQTSTCKKGEHLVTCPTYSFCCPDTAFCVCT